MQPLWLAVTNVYDVISAAPTLQTASVKGLMGAFMAVLVLVLTAAFG